MTLKQNKIFKDDVDKFEEKEPTKKRTLAKNTWYDCYDWLNTYLKKYSKKPLVVFNKKLLVSLKQANQGL